MILVVLERTHAYWHVDLLLLTGEVEEVAIWASCEKGDASGGMVDCRGWEREMGSGVAVLYHAFRLVPVHEAGGHC